jgi:hypothetical protein
VSDLGVGDAEIPTLTVQPADADTVAVLVVKAPDGSSTPVPVTGGALTAVPGTSPVEYAQTWTATDPVTYSAPGRWVLTWTVTGTGEGAEDVEVFVVASPIAGGPTWTPGLSRVAAYIPHRTIQRSLSSTTQSQDGYAWTWDDTTTPPASTVFMLISDAVAWVSARVSPLHASLFDLARAVAAIHTAAAIERSWPQADDELQRALDLEKRLERMLADLIEANNSANGTNDYGIEITPIWAFPSSDPRWDSSTYF